ncbi:DUF3097 domain-containing protein [Dermabacter hominis]|uniref:DUF3097 domain-containing protein n=1 Tax=Dermabacter hominis TaxID=36740 RepID=UPI00223BC7F7|nr:DUF3097 domain-containing protein [Dermabacter hominis]MCT2025639.1 DUF3097 domain-containing protein [Dermabacter hominis]
MNIDRYGHDVLSGTGDAFHPKRHTSRDVPAERGLVVEDVQTGWVGAVTRVEKAGGIHIVELEDRHGRLRTFRLGPGFLIDGKPVRLTPPTSGDPTAARQTSGPKRSASGSTYVEGARARVARGSRIWVEGKHDAELVEKVWGHDLRIEGIAVEMLDGADNLLERVRAFRPGPDRKLGVLVDHLVPGSKETRIAEAVMREKGVAGNVLILGHPYVDVWQAVKPARVGLEEWPHIPIGTDIKVGSLRALGLPAESQADIAEGWQKILSRVRSYADVEPTLSGRIEELIDFVTANP